MEENPHQSSTENGTSLFIFIEKQVSESEIQTLKLLTFYDAFQFSLNKIFSSYLIFFNI